MKHNSTRSSKTRVHRIGIYIRVSTEEQASNPEGSIKSQEQRLRQHVAIRAQEGPQGEIAHVYIDRAKSGKDMGRAELQRLLSAIRKGEVTLLLVTELSRLSRSIKDFCEIWDLMREHGCEFQSLREQFDTTSAAGEMVLYTIANIAQFERKQCSERIKANFAARAERGLFNGGAVPFGYELDLDRRGHLKAVVGDAEVVQKAFETFLKEGCLSKAGKALNDRGYRLGKRRQGGGNYQRLGHFTPDNLYKMLTSPAYIGQRVYKANGEIKVSQACWPAIVNEALFKRVQTKLKANYRRLKSHSSKRYPFLLSGLAVCASCGDRMPGKSAHGNAGKIPYYEHGWATKRQAYLNQKVFHCEPHRVLARIIEEAVWKEIERVLKDEKFAQNLIERAKALHQAESRTTEVDQSRAKVQAIQEQIEAVAEHLTQIPKGVSPVPIYAQMERLEEIKRTRQREYDKLLQSGTFQDLPISWRDYQTYLGLVKVLLQEKDHAEIRAQVARLIVAKVEILPDSFRIHFRVGKRDLGADGGKEDFFSISGSNSLINGRPWWTHIEPLFSKRGILTSTKS